MAQTTVNRVHKEFPNYRVIELDGSYLVRRDVINAEGLAFAVIFHKQGIFVFRSLDNDPHKIYADSEEFDRRIEEYISDKGKVICLVSHEGDCDLDLARKLVDIETFCNVVLRDYERFMEVNNDEI